MPKRRGHGEGTIYRRPGGLWVGQLTLRNPRTGLPKRVTFYGRTKSEVRSKMEEAKAVALTSGFVEPARVTVGEWLDVWLQEYARPSVRPTTWGCYEYVIRLHLKPAVGRLYLGDLRPEHLQAVYNEKLAAGLSNRTVRLIHTVIQAALKQAVREGLVLRNVAQAASPPRLRKKERRVLSQEEQRKFLAVLEEDRLGAAFLLDLATGLRRGEILGLRWQDVDLEGGTISVRRALAEVKSESLPEGQRPAGRKTALIFQEPKSEKGIRTIPVPEAVLPALRAHRARQAQERLLLGPAYQDHDLVFATADGKPIHPRNFTRSFYRLVQKAGIDRANLHALRHTFATRLLEANEHPKVVQELLGDSQISVVLDTYSHVSMDLKRRAMEKMSDLLTEERKPSPKQEGR
ncbi:MAG: tyrosine-type recombinase/integrase [Moorellales bacterium]